MPTPSSAISHVSDTALLVAGCRAIESARADAFFNDPFAAQLAGERGIAMFHALPHPEIMGFGIAIRTRFLDELLLNALAKAEVRSVVSLGAGLDTRPWRLSLPADLKWIEVDFAEMLEYKERLMSGVTPRCHRERIAADLNDAAQRRAIAAAAQPGPSMLITEGLLMYLPAATVEGIAAETQQAGGFAHWISDITTSSFFKAIGGGGTRVVRHVQAEDCLSGEQILECICRNGWKTADSRSSIRDLHFAAERIGRMMAAAPQPAAPPAFAPDDPTGVHRFERT